MAEANRFTAPSNSPAPRRLAGALAAGVVIAASGTAMERVYVSGLASLRIRFKASALTGTLTANIYPLLSTASFDDTDGAGRATTGAPVAVDAATVAEAMIEVDLAGERFVEVELSMSAVGGDTATIEYVEIMGVPA